jgi:hypothetical protein
MSWHWSGISLLLVAGAGYLTAYAVYVWRYRRGPTAASLVVVLAALAQWGVASAGALAAGDPAIKRVFCDLKYVGLVVLAPAAIVFVLQYAGFLRRPRPVLLGLLALEPVVVLVVLAIPATRHLFQTCLPSPTPSAAPMVRDFRFRMRSRVQVLAGPLHVGDLRRRSSMWSSLRSVELRCWIPHAG